jgi:hypothetical protein
MGGARVDCIHARPKIRKIGFVNQTNPEAALYIACHTHNTARNGLERAIAACTAASNGYIAPPPSKLFKAL